MVVHGNRGKCAGPCRLPYSLLENKTKIDSGYLLSPSDLCGLEHIPALVKAGVDCFKIEGRMKSPEYVAIVTKIYRKYIDLALSNSPYSVEELDKKNLMQAFNRGMSSSGHLESTPNRKLVYKEKPNNMGLFLGNVQKYNKSKGIITLKLNETIQIGDTISLEKETGTYTISELMNSNGSNITKTQPNQLVSIGRMKGNINIHDKIYKLSSKELNTEAIESCKKENRKIALNCKLTIEKNNPISIHIESLDNDEIYQNLSLDYTIDFEPIDAINKPLDKDSIIKQISKTASTPYYFKNIDINLGNNLFLPKLSVLNELRRNSLELVEKYALDQIKRKDTNTKINLDLPTIQNPSKENTKKISILLNILNENSNYENLYNIDNIYIPLKYFFTSTYSNILSILSKKSDIYIYLPTIMRNNYLKLFDKNINNILEKYNIKGFVLSNISNIYIVENILKTTKIKLNMIANYTFNIFNSHTILNLKKLGISKYTLSPELNKPIIQSLCSYKYLQNELIVYGNTPLMNMNYCLLGKTNKCYSKCSALCKTEHKYYLNDRLNMNFRIIPDNIQTVTTLYNSKITSIIPSSFDVDYVRIDILDESITEINNIIDTVKSGKRFEGNNYTNGNLNREL